MSAEEFESWKAYYELEPWGDKLHGMRAALQTSTIYNAGILSVNPKEFDKFKTSPTDFFIGVGPEKTKKPVRQTWKQQLAMLLPLTKQGAKK
jgi:hypothetical protein